MTGFSTTAADLVKLVGKSPAEGEEIMDWKVKSIDSAGAKLTKDARDIELPLYTKP
jgi:hypothetical protein